ncbi:hypothetical protein JHK86_024043 [Glycine max]|nr:hypothetical protein JHK86_024043 [Glycine max]
MKPLTNLIWQDTVFQDEHLTKANIDDSRAVLPTTSEDGTLTPLQLTTDLKPYLPSLRSLLHTHNISSVWDAISNQEAVKIVGLTTHKEKSNSKDGEMRHG